MDRIQKGKELAATIRTSSSAVAPSHANVASQFYLSQLMSCARRVHRTQLFKSLIAFLKHARRSWKTSPPLRSTLLQSRITDGGALHARESYTSPHPTCPQKTHCIPLSLEKKTHVCCSCKPEDLKFPAVPAASKKAAKSKVASKQKSSAAAAGEEVRCLLLLFISSDD